MIKKTNWYPIAMLFNAVRCFPLFLLLVIWSSVALAASDVTPKIQAGPKPDLVVSVDSLKIKVRDVGTGQVIRDLTLHKPGNKRIDLLLRCKPMVPGGTRCGAPFDRAGRYVVALAFGGRPFGDSIKSGYQFIPPKKVPGTDDHLELKVTKMGVTIQLYPSGWYKGKYQLSATIDSGNALNEANEGNNNAGPTPFTVELGPSAGTPHRRIVPTRKSP